MICKALVPNNTLITRTPEEGRALAIMLARHSVHAMQKELKVLKTDQLRRTLVWWHRRSHRRKRTPGPYGPGVLAMIGC